jgi:hypothetical protein
MEKAIVTKQRLLRTNACLSTPNSSLIHISVVVHMLLHNGVPSIGASVVMRHVEI